jgi:hypothetical protein
MSMVVTLWPSMEGTVEWNHERNSAKSVVQAVEVV